MPQDFLLALPLGNLLGFRKFLGPQGYALYTLYIIQPNTNLLSTVDSGFQVLDAEVKVGMCPTEAVAWNTLGKALVLASDGISP